MTSLITFILLMAFLAIVFFNREIDTYLATMTILVFIWGTVSVAVKYQNKELRSILERCANAVINENKKGEKCN